MPDKAEIVALLPEILLSAAGTLLLVLDPLTSQKRKGLLGVLSLAAIYAALLAAPVSYAGRPSAFSGMIVADGFATFFRALVFVIGFLVVLASMAYLKREELPPGEYYALILFGLAGQGLMAASSELIMIFLGLEISSISTYILVGFQRDDGRSSEAALKYFFLGSFATAFLLYGVALVYGATGSTRLPAVARALAASDAGPALLGGAAALLFVGLAFKVSAAPFHVWTPDVYQGAPSPVSAYLSTGPKAAAFAVFLRVFFTALGGAAEAWVWPLWISALLSMCIGNFAALVQTNVKRLLGYSSIAHAGYILVAFAAQSSIGVGAAMFYLVAYAAMNIGAFIVVAHVSGRGERYVEIDDYAGLGTRRPALAAALALFLLSLVGIPLTGGFFGKFYIFRAAINADLQGLAVLGLLNTALAAYYYLRVIVVMYMREPQKDVPLDDPVPPGVSAALVISAAATVCLGLFPGRIMEFAARSADGL